MRFHKIITIILFLNQLNTFSQKSFSNLDSLLRKNYKMVSKRDTSGYLLLLNKAAIFKQKNAKTKMPIDVIKLSYRKDIYDYFNNPLKPNN